MSARVGKHTDELIEELVLSTEGKTACCEWNTDGWGGYERIFGAGVDHYIGKTLTQRNERTNGVLRQQTERWLSLRHATRTTAEQVWQQTEVTARLVVSYFNGIWQHSQLKTTAAQRAGLTDIAWSWADLVAYPTLL